MRASCQRVSLFVLGILCTWVVPCRGQARDAAHIPAVCDLDNLASLTGMVSLSLGNHRVVDETMPCLLKLWPQLRNRGAGDFDVSNAFLTIMTENPCVFFSAMANESTIFAQWLGDLQDLSFTWADPPPCGLEAKRKQLILILEHTRLETAKTTSLKTSVVTKLSEIRCRQIN